MPSPLIPVSDLDRGPLGAEAQLLSLGTTLQAQFGSRIGMGKWVRHPLSALQIRGNVSNCVVTTNNASGELAYTIIGDTMILSLNATFTISGAAAGALYIRLPDNWQFAPRAAPGVPVSNLAPVLTSAAGAGTVPCFMAVGADATTQTSLTFWTASGATWGLGTSSIWGQLAFEVQSIGERS